MAAWRESDYAQLSDKMGRRIPGSAGSALCKDLGAPPGEPATQRRRVTNLFRNRAGTLALVLAVALALWVPVLAVIGAIWGAL